MSSISLAYALRTSATCATASAALALIQIADAADKNGCATMTASSLSMKIGCSETTARAAIHSLTAASHIVAKRLQHPQAGDVGFLLIINNPDYLAGPKEEIDLLWWAKEAVRRRSEKIVGSDQGPARHMGHTSHICASKDTGCNCTVAATYSPPASSTPPASKRATRGDEILQSEISRLDTPSFSFYLENNSMEQTKSNSSTHAGVKSPLEQTLPHYPGDLQPETWREFERVQHERGRPLTPTNVARFMKFMMQLASNGQSVEQSVAEATDGRWSRLYPPRKMQPPKAGNRFQASGDGQGGGHLGSLAALIGKART